MKHNDKFYEYLKVSTVFDALVKDRRLQHPTSINFDAVRWKEVFDEIDSPNERDRNILLGAVYFGNEIKTLRENLLTFLVSSHSRASATRLAASIANQQFLALMRKIHLSGKKHSKENDFLDLEDFSNKPIENSWGQALIADDHVTQIVDSLPNWLYHIQRIPDGSKANFVQNSSLEAGIKALTLSSLERCLRDMWQGILWDGQEISRSRTGIILRPHDQLQMKNWIVWHLRNQNIASFEHMIDLGVNISNNGKLPPVVPVVKRTVVKIERVSGKRIRFVIGKAKGISSSQRSYVSENDMLERLYTGIFLDDILPEFLRVNITCRNLLKAWTVIKDISNLFANELGGRRLAEDKALSEASCTIHVEDLIEVLSLCLDVERETAKCIVNIFTLDPSDGKQLFSDGLWCHPLLPASNNRRHLLFAPLTASPVRRVEAWLEAGGISDQRQITGRGKRFEIYVRSQIAKDLNENNLISDYEILNSGLNREGGEEVDLIFRIGRTVIVGEIKCFLAPVETIDRYNYISSLESAAVQASRKCIWVRENFSQIRNIIWRDYDGGDAYFCPIVVMNQGFGFGLEIGDVVVTDIHYLSIIVQGGMVQNSARFDSGRVTSGIFQMYRSQGELEKKFKELLNNPPTISHYQKNVIFFEVPFPT